MCWQRDESRLETPLDWAIVMEERNVIASIVRAIKQVRVRFKLGKGIRGCGKCGMCKVLIKAQDTEISEM